MRGGARACVGPCRKRRTNDALSGAGYATSSNSPARRKSVCRRDWDTAGALQSAQWWMTSANLFLPGVSLPGIALQRLEPIAPRSGPRMPKAKESVAGNKKLLSNPRQASHATMGSNRRRQAATEQTFSSGGCVTRPSTACTFPPDPVPGSPCCSVVLLYSGPNR